MPEHDIFRDGKVYVLAEECATCIFRPAVRPVPGARVAGMIRDTMDTDGATIVCHSTLYDQTDHNAICRGWFDRFAERDVLLRMAVALDIIEYQDVGSHTTHATPARIEAHNDEH